MLVSGFHPGSIRDHYSTSMENSQELIELSSINIASLSITYHKDCFDVFTAGDRVHHD